MKSQWIIVCLLPLLTACVSSRELTYINSGSYPNSVTISRDVLGVGDELLIRVAAVDERTVELFNIEPITVDEEKPTNYRIGDDGTISMPSLGKIHLAGMSQCQAQDTLARLIGQQVKEPVVLLYRTNAYVSVLGEVVEPGRYALLGDMTLLDVLAAAGDLTTHANRQSVSVLRIDQGQVKEYVVNMHDKQLFLSPAFALKKGDIIYVAPRFGKVVKRD